MKEIKSFSWLANTSASTYLIQTHVRTLYTGPSTLQMWSFVLFWAQAVLLPMCGPFAHFVFATFLRYMAGSIITNGTTTNSRRHIKTFYILHIPFIYLFIHLTRRQTKCQIAKCNCQISHYWAIEPNDQLSTTFERFICGFFFGIRCWRNRSESVTTKENSLTHPKNKY